MYHNIFKSILFTIICIFFLLQTNIQITNAAPILKLNAHGHDVVLLQENLKRLNYPITEINGNFSEETLIAVKTFQKDHNLPITGIVDRDTWWKLKESKAKFKTSTNKISNSTGNSINIRSKNKINIPEQKHSPPSQPINKPKPNKPINKSTKNNKKDKKNSFPLPIKIQTNHNESAFFGKVFLTNAGAKKILKEAHKYIGVPYQFGGTNPSGFDCSGYLQYVFAKFNVNIPRTADEQYFLGVATHHVNELVPGDLVFFNTYDVGVTHCGIYLGNNKFIHASTSRGVRVDDLRDDYWKPRYMGGKHIVRK